jgi:hypothetical protein
MIGRVLRLWAVLLALATTATACAAGVKTEADAARLAGQAVLHYKLTSLKEECFKLDLSQTKAYYYVGVREVHNAECGGASEIEPKLFTMRVRKRDGQITSDVYDGVTFRLVDHSKGK